MKLGANLRIIIGFILSCLSIPIVNAGEPVALASYYRNEGVVGAVRALRRAESGRRVLHVGAHPDDEDSALLAWLSYGQNARVSYMSLTRGEGGQNRLGPEKYADLGALRTAELLEARRIDGARQLFGRMIDFGFSKSGEEALRIWGRENIVEDLVRAIRLTRPQIIISRFKGDAADGHGQHQAVGMTIREAFDRAGDPNAFPDQVAQGLQPWRADKLYVMTFNSSPETTLTIDTGEYDMLSGRSFASIGYRGRSMHRSQDMGMEEFEAAVRPSYLIQVAPTPGEGGGAGLWDGAKIITPGTAGNIREILASSDWIMNPKKLAPAIARALSRWREQAPEDREALEDLQKALACALGIRIEALATASAVEPGGEAEARFGLYAPAAERMQDVTWSVTGANGDARELALSAGSARFAAWDRPVGAWPWFIVGGGATCLYPRPENVNCEGAPFESPAFMAVMSARYENVPFSLAAPVEWRWADPAFGEVRSDLVVVPRVGVRFEPDVVIRRIGAAEPPVIRIKFENYTPKPFEGRLEIHRAGEAVARIEISLDSRGRAERIVNISNAGAISSGEVSGEFHARWSNEEDNNATEQAMRVDRLDYRHIRPQTLVRPASLMVHSMDVKIPDNFNLGYVQGSGDEIAQALRGLGMKVTELTDADLATMEFSKFDAIALGVRAYETRPALIENNARLLDYARSGGTLVVQYNKSEFAGLGVAPYALTYSSPHDRVTDEAAAVEILDSIHSIFNYPNKITSADFEKWVQERGLYFWATWDEKYKPLLEMGDPGESPKRGGLLVADLGSGKYIYTGLAFFRQIPAGVEGAAKLFINLLAVGRGERKK